MVEKLYIKQRLTLDDMFLDAGTIVDGIRVRPDIYKVFVRNGWWAVPSNYFL